MFSLNKEVWSKIRTHLVRFYGTSTIVGYLIPNTVFAYILKICFVNTCTYTQLNDQTVLFATIHLICLHSF